jgi:hypothetical protein
VEADLGDVLVVMRCVGVDWIGLTIVEDRGEGRWRRVQPDT